MVVIASIGARRHAEKVAGWGADAVIVQGGEGGGHTGQVPSTLLLPQVVDAVGDQLVVIAAGGFFDGRGLVAALAYGAVGVAMGTRFLLTRESPVGQAVKDVYLSKSVTDTVVTTQVDGVPHRVLRSELVDRLERGGRVSSLTRAVRNAVAFHAMSGTSWSDVIREGLAMKKSQELSWSQVVMAANTPMLLKLAMVDGRPDLGVMASGQVVGLIEDLPSLRRADRAHHGRGRCHLAAPPGELTPADVRTCRGLRRRPAPPLSVVRSPTMLRPGGAGNRSPAVVGLGPFAGCAAGPSPVGHAAS